MSGWDPAQYLKFSQPRLRPALELLARVQLEAPASIYDLGCGTGALTTIMAERWPGAVVTGIDDSSEMLQRAAGSAPNVRWLRQDIALWSPEARADLIYSNAALHWLPDHERLLRRLIGYLAPAGVLAVQMPRNFPRLRTSRLPKPHGKVPGGSASSHCCARLRWPSRAGIWIY